MLNEIELCLRAHDADVLVALRVALEKLQHAIAAVGDVPKAEIGSQKHAH
jgi:hypothetical protein